MARKATHQKIVAFHESIANAHKKIKGFYRFDITELTARLRSGVETPVLMLESHSTDMSENTNQTVAFANKRISFLLLDFTGKADNYDKKEEVLDELENTALDIVAFLKHCHNDVDHWLYGLLDLQTIQIEKVGPLMDNMYGWNVIYTLKNHEPMCYDTSKWSWPILEPETPPEEVA